MSIAKRSATAYLRDVRFDRLDSGTFPARFSSLAPIAQGNLATIYRAVAVDDGREIALKVFEHDGDPPTRLPAVPPHPAVIALYDAGDVGPARYIVMELDDGVPLSTVMARGPVAPVTALRIVEHVAAGLAHLHRHGVHHGAIEPSHVMVAGLSTASPRARIVSVDGVPMRMARARRPATKICRGRGAMISFDPAYQPPEVAIGLPSDGRADIYSTGMLLFALLTGGNPFSADNLFTSLRRVVHDATPRLPPTLAGIPGFEALLRHALARDPADRIPSAAALLVKLADVA